MERTKVYELLSKDVDRFLSMHVGTLPITDMITLLILNGSEEPHKNTFPSAAVAAIVSLQQFGAPRRMPDGAEEATNWKPTAHSFEDVCALINDEREYQENLPKSRGFVKPPLENRPMSTFAVMLSTYSRQAADRWTLTNDLASVLSSLRKVAAVAVQALEVFAVETQPDEEEQAQEPNVLIEHLELPIQTLQYPGDGGPGPTDAHQ